MISAQEMSKLYLEKEVEREQLRVEHEAKEKIRIDKTSNRVLLQVMEKMKFELKFPIRIDGGFFEDQAVLNDVLFELRNLGYLVLRSASINFAIEIDVPK